MNEVMEKEIVCIKNMIYKIDGVKMKLNSNLANLYQAETKRINETLFLL